ncbi:MAG: hypothetical protein AAB913_02095 [Patescibacteria group bacterium]
MKQTTSIPEFGIKRDNEERRDGGCAVVFDPQNQKYAVYRNLKNEMLGLYGGGFDENENKNYDHWIYFLRKSVNRAIELGYDTINQNPS